MLLPYQIFVTHYQQDWDQLLPMTQISLDNKPAASTGISPFFLTHGYHAVDIQLDEQDYTTAQGAPQERALCVAQKLADARDFAKSTLVTT